MTDEELKKELHTIRLWQAANFMILMLTILLLGAVQSCETKRLICSAENPPRACKE